MDNAEEVTQLMGGHQHSLVVAIILDHCGAPHLAPAVRREMFPEVFFLSKKNLSNLPFNTGAANISVAHGGFAVRFVDGNIGLQVQSSQSERDVKMGTIRSGKKTINIFTRK